MAFLDTRRRRPRRLRRFTGRVLLATVAVAASACGGDDCAGVLTVNVSAAECESLAQQFGCSGFDVEGPRCGLFGCASCGDLVDEGDGE